MSSPSTPFVLQERDMEMARDKEHVQMGWLAAGYRITFCKVVSFSVFGYSFVELHSKAQSSRKEISQE
jgi:hypothetical protein